MDYSNNYLVIEEVWAMILLIMKLPTDPDAQEDYEGLRRILSHSFSSATILLKMQWVLCFSHNEEEGKLFRKT